MSSEVTIDTSIAAGHKLVLRNSFCFEVKEETFSLKPVMYDNIWNQ